MCVGPSYSMCATCMLQSTTRIYTRVTCHLAMSGQKQRCLCVHYSYSRQEYTSSFQFCFYDICPIWLTFWRISVSFIVTCSDRLTRCRCCSLKCLTASCDRRRHRWSGAPHQVCVFAFFFYLIFDNRYTGVWPTNTDNQTNYYIINWKTYR